MKYEKVICPKCGCDYTKEANDSDWGMCYDKKWLCEGRDDNNVKGCMNDSLTEEWINVPNPETDPKITELIEMGLHEITNPDRDLEIMRVIGGWIYSQNLDGKVTSVFVPEATK